MTIRSWLREQLHFHWQNLNDSPDPNGPGLVHGRAWFGLQPLHKRGVRAAVEWLHGRLGLAAFVRLDRDDRELTLHIAFPGASYFLSLEGLPEQLFARLPFSMNRTEYAHMGSNRLIGFNVHGGALWLSLWEDAHEWRSSDPAWWRARIGLDDIADALFGKVEYSRTTLEERDVEIPMYEGAHAAKAKRELAKWTRPRWPWKPFSKQRVGVSIDIPNGIETDHKGPLFGISTPASTIAEGVGHVVSSVLRSRGQLTAERP